MMDYIIFNSMNLINDNDPVSDPATLINTFQSMYNTMSKKTA